MDLRTRIVEHLERRKQDGSYRSLEETKTLVDFCSNDYLGFVAFDRIGQGKGLPGASGAAASRLLRGEHAIYHELESTAANFHHSEAALLFNSGYSANLGLLSTVPKRGDTILYDELCHASMRDGIRLSLARAYKFRHNDVESLREVLARARGSVFVLVESVYSMDGDLAPLSELVACCHEAGAHLIVDEAHAVGVFGDCGRGRVCELDLQESVFARIVTFGKSLGTAGALILSSQLVREYLVNFCRPFIYTTAMPPALAQAAVRAYELLSTNPSFQEELRQRIALVREQAGPATASRLLPSMSPIQSVLVPGNRRSREVSGRLQRRGFDVRALLAPTVPNGSERLRITLHLHNSAEEIGRLVEVLEEELPE